MNTDQSKTNGSTEFLNFSDALHHVRWGERVARRSWTSGRYLYMQYGCENHVMSYTPGDGRGLLINGIDIAAEDWYVLGEGQ